MAADERRTGSGARRSTSRRSGAPGNGANSNGSHLATGDNPHLYGLETEQGVVGALLLGGAMSVSSLAAIEHLSEEDFWLPAHQHIVAAARAVHGRGDPVDVALVANELAVDGLLDQVGGNGELVSLLANGVPASAVPAHARLIAERAALRRCALLGLELSHAATEGDTRKLASLQVELVERASPSSVRRLPWEDVAGVMRGEEPPIVPALLRRSDGAALMYPGLLHWLMGEPGKGKTMIALHATAEVIGDGGAAAYLDWEGNRRIIGSRLSAFELDPAVIASRLWYMRPPILTPDFCKRVAAVMAEQEVKLAVFDGVAKALARQGFDEDKAPQILAWLEMIVTPLTEAGVCCLLLDHVTKEKDGRGLWPRGSGAKLGEVSGAAWMVRPRVAFSRGQSGKVDLVQAKDREGFLGTDGSVVATVTFAPSESGQQLRVTVLAPDANDAPFRPTGLMAAVSAALQAAPEPIAKRTVRSVVRGRSDWKDTALERLVIEGYVEHTKAGYRSVKPFQEDEFDPDGNHEGWEEDEHEDF